MGLIRTSKKPSAYPHQCSNGEELTCISCSNFLLWRDVDLGVLTENSG